MSILRNVAVFLFEDAEVLDFCGPIEVFSVASQRTQAPSFNVFTVAERTPVLARSGLSVNPDFLLPECPSPDVLLVPGGLGSRREMNHQPTIEWIARTSEDAELVLSVCTGALLLAKAGLLDGLEATTHHVAYDLLREIAPRTTVYEDRQFVDNGRIVTSAGIAAGIDMCLHVVQRLLGANVAEETARHMEYPWSNAGE